MFQPMFRPMFRPMRAIVTLLAIALLSGCLPAIALAGGPQLELPQFERLRHAATESVDVSIGGWPLGLAAGLAGLDDDPEDAEFKELLRGLKGVYIRSYQFGSDYTYPSADVDAVRAQLSSPDWSPLAQIRSHRDGEKVDIYVCMSHEKIAGLALIVSGPREFTIVNVVGSLDPQKLATLEKRFGLRHPAG